MRACPRCTYRKPDACFDASNRFGNCRQCGNATEKPMLYAKAQASRIEPSAADAALIALARRERRKASERLKRPYTQFSGRWGYDGLHAASRRAEVSSRMQSY